MTLFLDKELADAIEDKARLYNIDVGDFVRHLLKDGLDRDHTFLTIINAMPVPVENLEIVGPTGMTDSQAAKFQETLSILTAKPPPPKRT